MLGETAEQSAAAFDGDVARDATLVDVAGQPREAALELGPAAGEGRYAPAGVASGRLDLDHVRAQIP